MKATEAKVFCARFDCCMDWAQAKELFIVTLTSKYFPDGPHSK
jgi:hypothetical protein